MVKKKTGKKKSAKAQSTSLVKYGGYSAEEAEEDAQELEEAREGAILKLKPGKITVRMVPPLPGKKWRKVSYEHFIDVPGIGRVMFTCPRLVAKEFCPVCQRAQQLAGSSNPVDQKKAKNLQPKRRLYANVIVRGQEEKGVRVLAFGPQIEDQLIEIRRDQEFDFVDPTDEGVDVVIRRKGTQMDTEYKVFPANKGAQLPLHADVVTMNEWIKNQHALERYVQVLSADDIERKLRGEKPKSRDDEDEDDDETPRSRGSRGRSVADEIDDEDDIDDADWEDEDEEEDDD